MIAAGNFRNLPVLALVGCLAIANAGFHYEISTDGASTLGTRAGLSLIVMLILLISGRVIPNFTSNWLADKAKGVMPTPFNGVDRACIVLAGGALVGWTFWPEHTWTGGAMIAAGIGHVARCLRWAGWRTLPEPLLAVLHIAYLFVPAGFISLGLSIYFPNLISGTASMHLWTAGTVGLTTTAIMARAVLGHTGAPLRAGTGLVLVFVLVAASAMVRYLSGFAVDPGLLLTSSAVTWIVGFFWLSVLLARQVGRSGDTPN